MGGWQEAIFRFLKQAIWSQIWARILFAAMFAGLVMLLLNWTDLVYLKNQSFCPPQQPYLDCVLKQLISMLTITNIQSYGLVFVATLYVLEGSDRKRQSHYEAWQILDATIEIETSYARLKALQDLNKDGISLKGFDFPGADLDGIELYRADLREVKLQGASLRGADLRRANLSGADLRNAKLTSGPVSLNGRANSTVIRTANLTGADFSGADLRGADLTGAILDYVCLKDTRIDWTTKISPKGLLIWQIVNNKLQETYLRGTDLSKTVLTGAFLEDVDLEDADLSKADLTGANLSRSNFAKANFKAATLTNANFSKAYLVESNFLGASRIRANFKDAELTGAKFGGRFFWFSRLDVRKSTSPTSVFARKKHNASTQSFGGWFRDRKSFAPSRVLSRKSHR